MKFQDQILKTLYLSLLSAVLILFTRCHFCLNLLCPLRPYFGFKTLLQLIKLFLLGLKVLIGPESLNGHTSSYWAHPLIKVKELRFQSHALHIDKFFYQDMK